MKVIRKQVQPDGEVRLFCHVNEPKLDSDNAIGHSPKNIDRIKKSIVRYGQQSAIVVDPRGVVAKGNGTLVALRELGHTEVWFTRTDLEGNDRIGYAIADNRTSEGPEWIDAVVSEQLLKIRDEDGVRSLEATGFTERDLADLIARSEPVDEDPVEPVIPAALTLKWGDRAVVITADESAMLDRALERYEEDSGTMSGFVRSLIRV